MALGLKLQLLKKEIIKIGSADQQCIQMNNPTCWRRKKFSTYLCAGQRLLEAQKEPNVVYAFKIKKGHIFFFLNQLSHDCILSDILSQYADEKMCTLCRSLLPYLGVFCHQRLFCTRNIAIHCIVYIVTLFVSNLSKKYEHCFFQM